MPYVHISSDCKHIFVSSPLMHCYCHLMTSLMSQGQVTVVSSNDYWQFLSKTNANVHINCYAMISIALHQPSQLEGLTTWANPVLIPIIPIPAKPSMTQLEGLTAWANPVLIPVVPIPAKPFMTLERRVTVKVSRRTGLLFGNIIFSNYQE